LSTSEQLSAPKATDFPEDRPWHTQEQDVVVGLFESSPDGLTEAEARARLERAGPNEIEREPETPWWRIVLDQFRDPLIYILLVAAAAMLLLDHLIDAGVIMVVVVLNATIGYVQQSRAQQAMRSLASLTAPMAEVIRDGHVHEIPSRDLVPGDLVALASGARVPADVRLVSARELEIDEAALTGESVPARKRTDPLAEERLVPGDQVNMAFSGTVVTRGRGRGIVVRTGRSTEIGRIAVAVRETGQTKTPLQHRMERLAKQIGLWVLVACGVVGVIGIIQGRDSTEIFVAAVALAVASIPEGLPVVLTITLAIGVSRMARRRAIIRALPAVETLGSTTVIGSDKTGTLTKNEMTVRAIFAGGERLTVSGTGYEAVGQIERDGRTLDVDDNLALRETLLAGALANEADPETSQEELAGDPTEIALHVAAAKGGLSPGEARRHHPELDILPFESERRFMATLNSGPGGHRLYVKGAPEVVLARCHRQAGERGEEALDLDGARAAAREMADEGLRVLAMAYREVTTDRIEESLTTDQLVFAGLEGMEDPLRPEALDAVRAARGAGIRVMMLTGDHLGTATAIGTALGLVAGEGRALDGGQLEEMSDEEWDEAVREVNVYARVAPEHKLRIVQKLKEQGEVVAVTGDGVNDAPALRAAHLGVAMGRGGTDVAREASDMVLADDNFATITAAIEEGRVVFANVRKVTFFLLSTAVGQILVLVFAVVANWPLPLLAAQILWVNLVTNGLQDVALAFEPGEPRLLEQKPRPHGEGVVTWRILERLVIIGTHLAAGTLLVFWYVLTTTADLELARTAALTQLVVFQFFHVFNSRSLDRSILSIPLFSNRFLFLSVIAAFAAHLAALHWRPLQLVFRTVPLSLETWGWIVLIGSTIVLGGELDKWINRKRGRRLG
jgi:magnesium-transporting ATPase (P-type)